MRRPAAALLALLLAGAAAAPVARDVRERAYRANNRGVGLLEQFRPAEAAASFREALSLDPDLALGRSNLALALLNVPDLPGAETQARAAVAARPDWPQGHYVLALALRGQNKTPEAEASLRAVLRLDPADVGAHVNLGQIFLQERDYPRAIAHLRAAIASEPHNGTALYNLGLALTRSGQAEAGREHLERFQALRDSGAATLIGQVYPEQGRHAEGLVSSGAEAELVNAAQPDVRFSDATPPLFPARAEAPPAKGAVGQVVLLDLDGDGWLDLFEVTPQTQRLFRGSTVGFAEVGAGLGLPAENGGLGAVAGDLDNDGRTDLLVLREGAVTLFLNGADKGLLDATSRGGLARLGGAATAALADFDHDGDLDILLSGAGAPDRLLQNSGTATFKDVAEAAGLATDFRALASLPTDYDNGRDMDLLEIGASGGARLLRNLRDGTFRDVAADLGLPRGAGLRCLTAADVNKDSYPDLFFGADASDLLALSDGRGRYSVAPAPWAGTGTRVAQLLDYDNDGLLDLLSFSPAGARLLRNLGSAWSDVSERALGDLRRAHVESLASGDVDGDGDTDLVVREASGRTRLWRNDGGHQQGAVRVRLAGLVSNRSAVGAKLELRAGSLRQKLETSASSPAAAPADVLFGLGGRGTADAVRVLWPAGILQTELGPLGAVLEVRELNRKPSSCPYLYAWNGRAFEFVTDFMGGGEMGYYEGPGLWNQPDPLEYVRLTDQQLRARDGRYELRVTNELEEALFVDRLALLSIEHPQHVEVYPAEGLTSPPRPQRLFALSGLRAPRRAEDDHGHDVLARLARVDRSFPDDFGFEHVRGHAKAHHLLLDLGALAERSALVLTGWTDYAFSSDNLAGQQAGLTLLPPSLEVEDAAGAWHTAIAQVGLPVGRPQAVAVDLTGIWRGPSRRVRLSTSLRVYWDQIRVGEIVTLPLAPRTLQTLEARLRERGFSAEVSPDGREPFGYDYTRVSRRSPWKAFPGRYTREGDVGELLAEADDVFVSSRPGDELVLAFEASLPALAAGRRRTFLLLSDGFSKEMDLNSATPDTLGPLPFHGMSRYPYAPPEAFPMTDARRRLFERYNTRVVRAPVLPLDAELALHE